MGNKRESNEKFKVSYTCNVTRKPITFGGSKVEVTTTAFIYNGTIKLG